MKVKTPMQGQLCESLQGRDKGNLYAVLRVLGEDLVLVADGDTKKLSCPKKKNIKHLSLLNKSIGDYGVDFSDGKADDCRLAYALKQYRAERKIKVGGNS